MGTATFHGTVASQGYTHVFAEVRVGEDVRSQTTVPLCGAAPVAFDLAVPIPSELTAFDVHLSLVRDDTRQEFFTVTDLVAGDLYVITGQSNSVAGQVSGDANENQGPFIRSFGSNTTDGNASAADVAWRIADGNGYGGNAIGQWGIRMAALLSAAHETPIGVVNGGLGGLILANTPPDAGLGQIVEGSSFELGGYINFPLLRTMKVTYALSKGKVYMAGKGK